MAKSTSNSAKRIFGRKRIKTIYTLSILSFVIQGFKNSFRYFFVLRQTILCLDFLCYFCNQLCEFCIVFHYGKIKQIIKVLKCSWCSKVPRGVFLLIIFIIIWSNVITAWLALDVSGTTSLIASSRACCRHSIKSVFIWPVHKLAQKWNKQNRRET